MERIKVMERSDWLDWLRMIAVLLVMIAHFIGATTSDKIDLSPEFGSIASLQPILSLKDVNFIHVFVSQLTHGFSEGASGVCLFFLVTGFLIPSMLEKYTRTQFLLNRFFRIYPALAVVMLLMCAVRYYVLHMAINGNAIFENTVLLLPIQQLMTGVLWTLPIEIYFYLLCFVVGKFKTISQLFGLQLGLAALASLAALAHHTWSLRILSFILYINLGSWVYFFSSVKLSYRKIVIFLSLALLIFSTTLVLCQKIYPLLVRDMGYDRPIFFYWYAIFCAAFCLRKFFAKLNVVCQLIADCCYPLYLMHWFFGGTVMILLKREAGISNSYILLLSAIIVVTLLAKLIHHSVEKPAIAFAKSLNKKLRPELMAISEPILQTD
ncbi:MAG TPA: acyltransferase [Gammaproteobacteria bacterium]|jgi:peptidoglycan/LPS O-acetylase OafA/YrhL|nr:acyltransferase [Gammaproteobacteria bacterium]